MRCSVRNEPTSFTILLSAVYRLAIGIVHRMVAFEKRMCFRMTKWKPLFEGLSLYGIGFGNQ